MIKVKYLAISYGKAEIQKIQVVGETNNYVIIMQKKYMGDGFEEAKRRKKTESASYFDTFQDAKDWLTDIAEQKLNSARRKLEKAQEYHGNVKGMKE